MKKVVSVTQEHIDRGLKCSIFRCPIALSLREALGIDDDHIVTVGSSEASVNHGRQWAFLPNEALEFIYKFDHDRPVEPITFELEFEGFPY